VTDDKQTIDRR